MHTSTYTDLVLAINNFNEHYCRPHGKIELTQLIQTIPNTQASWPSNDFPGVYLFMDSEKNINYIGKSSINIGVRLSARFNTKWEPKSEVAKSCSFITTIELPIDVFFEAPAIEEFLLSRLNTKFNTICNPGINGVRL